MEKIIQGEMMRKKAATIPFLFSLLLLLVPCVALPATYTSQSQRVEAVKKLEEKFSAKEDYYLSGSYNEKNVRTDFIDPFFETLDWDIKNSKELLLYQRDSVPESLLEIYKYPKRVDYSQRIDDRFVFFIEAKGADKDLDDKDYIFQAKRYCWSTGTTEIVILTGYSGMRVFDCRIKPDFHKPEQGELKQFRLSYTDYDEKFDLLWKTFGKENVKNGSIKKLLASTNKSLEKQTMEKALVKSLESMRLNLARDINKNNQNLSEKEVSEASQTILNKIFFTRILEDRNIITTKRLHYAVATFYKDDSLYMGNKGHYLRAEKMREPKATLFLEIQEDFADFSKRFNGAIFTADNYDGLKISNDVLRDIIVELYQTYDFSVVPIHIIGKAHESYLGKTISIEKGGWFSSDKVEMRDRPEVKSAGGVFYTEEWVADYMVRETLGKTMQGKDVVALSKIKVLDPACGSGVFPAIAAKQMFDHAENYYTKNPSKIGGTAEFPDAIKLSDGRYVLSAKKRASIIENSIFCVDIDAQAIENTKMWLYILMLEHSGISTAEKERKRKIDDKVVPDSYDKFALPQLNENIVNGNSLVGTDFGNEKENKEANAYDWNAGKIGTIIKSGGFDVVIGNPPYIRNQKLQAEIPEQYQYMKKRYKTLAKGNTDIFFAFFEKGQSLLKKDGSMGLIVSASALTAKSADNLRTFLADKVYKIINFGGNSVFPGVGVASTIIFTTEKPHSVESVSFESVKDIKTTFISYANGGNGKDFYSVKVSPDNLKKQSRWTFGKMDGKLKAAGQATIKLGDVANVFQGQNSGANDIFLVDNPLDLEKECIRPYIRSKDVKRYMPVQGKEWIIYAYGEDGKLLKESEFKKRCPNAHAYMVSHKSTLLEKKERRDHDWFKLARNTNHHLCLKPKIFTNFVDKDTPQDFSLETTGGLFIPGFSFAVSSKTKNISNEMLLGILNSKLMRGYLYESGKNFGKKKEINVPKLKDIPFVSFTKSTAQTFKHIEMLVIEVMDKKKAGKDTGALESKIDTLVNELYGTSGTMAANDNLELKSVA